MLHTPNPSGAGAIQFPQKLNHNDSFLAPLRPSPPMILTAPKIFESLLVAKDLKDRMFGLRGPIHPSNPH